MPLTAWQQFVLILEIIKSTVRKTENYAPDMYVRVQPAVLTVIMFVFFVQ